MISKTIEEALNRQVNREFFLRIPLPFDGSVFRDNQSERIRKMDADAGS